jgi:hypothetical protein
MFGARVAALRLSLSSPLSYDFEYGRRFYGQAGRAASTQAVYEPLYA